MNIPSNLKYSKSHEWIKFSNDNTAKIGLTDYAQSELGDIVFVNLPTVGEAIVLDETFADVESVKAVSDVYSPLTAKVAAVNEALEDEPELINSDCYDAWLIEVEEIEATGELMNDTEYEAYIAEL